MSYKKNYFKPVHAELLSSSALEALSICRVKPTNQVGTIQSMAEKHGITEEQVYELFYIYPEFFKGSEAERLMEATLSGFDDAPTQPCIRVYSEDMAPARGIGRLIN